MDITALQELGLTNNETRTYKALLEVGETKTGVLVKKTGMHRVLIYDALESLIKKGLATYVIKENIKYFQASDPERLVDFLKEKQELATKIIPSLKALQSESKSKQSVVVYEGIKGLKSAMNNMLDEISAKEYHYVFASGNMAETMSSYYTLFQNIKKKKKVQTHILYDQAFRARKDVTKITYGKIKYQQFTYFPTDTWIYNDKVLIVTYTANPPVAILITSKETALSYKKMFEGFWRTAEK